MAATGGRGARGKGTGKPRPHRTSRAAGAGRASGAGRPSGAKNAARPDKAGESPTRGATQTPLPAGPFRLGAIEGATPGKWIDTWKQRMPHAPLDLVPLTLTDQRASLTDATVDAALVRLPIDRTGLHVIGLYDEAPVVVCAADSHLTAADELAETDLAGEVLITPRHPPLSLAIDGTLEPRFAAPATVADAIALAATGIGVVIVPLSLARLHHRKDVTHRALVNGPTSTVALAWPAHRDDPADPLVDAFIGIVRGRTANSSR